MEDYPELTNKWVAERLGLSESGVSRLRSGDRLPSLDVMQQIEKNFNWPVQDQSNARAGGIWTAQFKQTLDTAARARANNPNRDPKTGELTSTSDGQKPVKKPLPPKETPERPPAFNTTVDEYTPLEGEYDEENFS